MARESRVLRRYVCREGKRFACAGMKIRHGAHGKSKIFSFSVMVEVLASLARIKLAHRRMPLAETSNPDSQQKQKFAQCKMPGFNQKDFNHA